MTDARSATERMAELTQLRERHAFESSSASSFALAKSLWQNGLYDEALAQFNRTRDLAPQAPDASIALIRAEMMMGRLDEARSAVEHALRHDPDLPILRVHQAQLLASQDPAAARDVLAAHRDTDALAHLFHNALDDIANGRQAAEQAFGNIGADAMWAGHVWLSSQKPQARITGSAAELLRLAIAEARIDGLTLCFGSRKTPATCLLAQWCDQGCHGFEAAPGMDESQTEQGHDQDIEWHPGRIEEVLPAFLSSQKRPIRLLRIDSDSHEASLSVLSYAKPWLREGSILIFDHFIGFPDSDQRGFRAFHEFAASNSLGWRVAAGTLLSREVAIVLTT